MADDKRLTTLKALCAHLADEIQVANGYQHDIPATSIFRGRAVLTESDPTPCLAIMEALNPDRFPRVAGSDDNVDIGLSKEGWIILVQGWAADDKENPSDPAYRLMADVKKALAKLSQGPSPQTRLGGHANFLLGGLITRIQIEPGTVRPPDQNSALAYFYVRVVLGFVEKISDPFDLS